MTDRYLRWEYKRSCEKKGNYTRIILETLNQQLFKEVSSRVQYLLLFALGFERGHTVMNVTLESRENFLEATVIGQLSLSEAIEVFKKIVDAAAERGLVNILVDSLAVEGELSTLERYELGKTMAEYCGRQSMNLKWAAIGKAPAVVRWAAQGRGKRGGFRVIYYFHSETFPLFLLTVYSKNQKANLTKAERNELKKLVPLLVKTYTKGSKR